MLSTAKKRKVSPAEQGTLRELLNVQLISKSVLCELLEQLGHDDMSSELRQTSSFDQHTTTPYGLLFIDLPLKVGDGGPDFMWPICNPFALLYLLCERTPRFARFLQSLEDRSKVDAKWDIYFYTDEETPGNQKRHDSSRKTQCHYWGIKQFPHWFRRRTESWLVLGYMPCDIEETVSGGLSGVLKHALEFFFSAKGFNLFVGCRLPVDNSTFTLRAGFSFFIQDFNAHTATWCTTGAGGRHPCIRCDNIEQNDPEKVCEPFKHIAVALPHEFQQQTAETFFKKVDLAAGISQLGLSKGKMDELRKELGFTHTPNGLANSHQLRKYIDPIKSTYFDWMHSTVASGSMGQYEVNSFCLVLVAEGVTTLAGLDEFSQSIKWPPSRTKLPKNFFQKRVTKTLDGHISAFAGETINAIIVLSFYAETHLDVENLLPEHSRCMKLLCQIVDMLLCEPVALQSIPFLRATQNEHHILLLKLYSIRIVKLKPHIQHHVPESMEEWGVVANCFSAERAHQIPKAFGHHCKRGGRQYMVGVLNRSINMVLGSIHKTPLQPIYLEGCEPMPSLRTAFSTSDQISALTQGLLDSSVQNMGGSSRRIWS